MDENLLNIFSNSKDMESVVLRIATLQTYRPSSSSLRYKNCSWLVWLFPSEVIGITLILSLVTIASPLGAIQEIFTMSEWTSGSVWTLHQISYGLPTIKFSVDPYVTKVVLIRSAQIEYQKSHIHKNTFMVFLYVYEVELTW